MAGELRFQAIRTRAFGKWGHLIGFLKGRAVATVSVNPPSINGGATGHVDVTVTGAKANRRYRVVMIPPATLETGLVVLDTPIISDDTVRVNLLNSTADAIDGTARNWSAHLFSQVP